MRTETYVLPSFLASALINGDVSGLTDADLPWVITAENLAAGGHYVDVSDECEDLRRYCDLPGWRLLTDMQTYTVLYPD